MNERKWSRKKIRKGERETQRRDGGRKEEREEGPRRVASVAQRSPRSGRYMWRIISVLLANSMHAASQRMHLCDRLLFIKVYLIA